MSGAVPEPARPNAAGLGRLPPNARGALWYLVAGAAYTIMTAMIKLLGQRIPVVEIVLFRQVVMLLVVSPAILRGFPGAFRTERFGLHALRVAIAGVSILTGFTAIVHLPLAEATAISFSKSLFVTLYAGPLLGELVGRARWAATAIGFAGVLVMLRPTGEGVALYYGLLAIGSAAAAAIISVIIRKLARTERAATILAYQATGLGVLLAPPALLGWVQPSLVELALLIGIGLFSSLGQVLSVMAFRAGEAAAIAPIDYARLLMATALGFLLFAELPTPAAMLGAAMIVGTSLFTFWHEARRPGGSPPPIGP